MKKAKLFMFPKNIYLYLSFFLCALLTLSGCQEQSESFISLVHQKRATNISPCSFTQLNPNRIEVRCGSPEKSYAVFTIVKQDPQDSQSYYWELESGTLISKPASTSEKQEFDIVSGRIILQHQSAELLQLSLELDLQPKGEKDSLRYVGSCSAKRIEKR